MLVIVCPGQGSQTPGFLAPWLELPGFRDRMAWLSAVAGMDLVAHGTESDAETIKDTAVAQPLIVGAGLISLLALFEHPADGHRAVAAGAGHSVGEITAAAAAGVMTAEQAMVFVRERGRAMAAASAVTPTGMSAVLGGDPEDVAATLERHGLTAANNNGGGQLVAAGTLEQLEALKADPPAKARVIPLQVAGAFHTHHMAPAVDVLAGYARAISTHDPRTRLVSNAAGAVVHDGRQVLKRLVSQVSNPVRWDLCMETFKDIGVTGLIEIPPAGTLANLAKRGLPGVEVLALKTPDDLEAAHRMVREHAQPSEVADNPTWRLVIAPAKGTVTYTVTEAGTTVPAGSVVATVNTLRDSYSVTAPHGGRVIEWLVEDGDPVSPGQPLLRLHPTEA
ncbi:acyltransferase domain-containing protein [Oryzihumus leptocrescens]|uniref:[acyl-carrier-protein] S-malonyltransferase n=1 Tax=Oryzihumus leptocrescens TaxID=297536 RepID=A0A542ZHR0_9MICO|nr:acyltransferase domain-containing protein [Oryzihumus leptocrescens]TQL59897.1 [acyl-carrier-protein] S-malonyltransferase [Oryzihumus leptocrescens]